MTFLGKTKTKILLLTASESIDSIHPTFPRRNDMFSEACNKLASYVIPCQTFYVIPAEAHAWHGIYRRSVQRSKTLNDGLIRYRSHAFAHKPSQG